MPLRTLARTLAALAQSDSVASLLVRLGILRGTDDDPTDNVAFTIALVALSAKLARSDGAVTRPEEEVFARIVVVPPGERANVRRLFDLAKRDVAGFETYARQIGHMLRDRRTVRHDVLEALFHIAAADGTFHELEEVYLRRVAVLLDIPTAEYGWVRSQFVTDASSPYELLGLTPASTDAELKARHREIVRDTHPDRLVGRGLTPAFIAAAERRLAAVNAAYDVITREREKQGRRLEALPP